MLVQYFLVDLLGTATTFIISIIISTITNTTTNTSSITSLGNDTMEAKIFQRAMMNEMKEVLVVSYLTKALVVLLVVLLNIYFVYGSVLYGSSKSVAWQMKWVQVLVFNLLIDVMYTSMVEVMILILLILLLLLLLILILLGVSVALHHPFRYY